MPIGSYPGCCLFFTGISSGGTSSRLSGSVRFGSADGSNIRCAFHGGATSSLLEGITCAFAGEARLIMVAAAGAAAIMRRHRRNAFAERENEHPPSITCPLGETTHVAIVLGNDRCPKKHREPLTKVSAAMWSTSSSTSPEVAKSDRSAHSSNCNASGEKKFSALQNKICTAKRRHYGNACVSVFRVSSTA